MSEEAAGEAGSSFGIASLVVTRAVGSQDCMSNSLMQLL